MSPEAVDLAKSLIEKHKTVFGNDIPGYNGFKGKFEASFEFSSHERPIIGKTQVPVYNKKHSDIFQQKCDLEHARGRIQSLSELGEQPALINNAFLVLKQSAAEDGKTLQNCDVTDVRLVCSFNELGKYIKKMPAKITTEAEIWARTARFNLMGETDLTDAFSQMNMRKDKRKYLCFLTPHKGIMCYSSGPQGLLGMSEYLDNMTDLVLGDLIMDNICLKIHDQLFVGGKDEKTLLQNWDLVLSRLGRCDLRLKPSKTNITIQTAVIYGKIWERGTLTPSPHKLTPLSYVNRPGTVGDLRSFIGGSKIHAECLKGVGHHQARLTPLTSNDKKSTDTIVWTEETSNAFSKMQNLLKDPQTIIIPRPQDQKYIIPDAATKSPAFGAILIVNRKEANTDEDNFKIGGYFNTKLKEGLNPCEAEAQGIDRASEHWDHYSRESVEPTIILSDSDPCVRSLRRMSKGKFSTSSKLQNFLHKLSGRFVKLHHVSAKMNSKLIEAADYQSRHYQPCSEDQQKKCPYCIFSNCKDDTLVFARLVRSSDLENVIDDPTKIPFQSKQGWKSIQTQCKDLKRAVTYIKTNTRPGVRDTKIKDVKRYLQQDLVIDTEGLLLARKEYELEPRPRNLIVIPRAFSRSFIRLLHNETSHPPAAQTLAKFNKRFYALDAKSIVDEICKNCELCNSTDILPKYLRTFTSTVKPGKPGTHAAADVLMREKQKIVVFREVLTSHTSTMLIDSQTHQDLRTAIIKLALFYKSEDSITVRIDNAPGFLPLKDDPVLKEYNIILDFGEEKNQNHNPVAEKAIREIEEVIVKLLPRGGEISEIVLSKATEVLNKIIRHSGYNSQELLTSRDQTTGAKLDFPDSKLSDLQWKMRTSSHGPSAKYESRDGKLPNIPKIKMGDVVLLKSERSKHKAREKYFVVDDVDEEDKVQIQKITENQIRARKYKVKIEEIMQLNNYTESKSDTEEEFFSAAEDNFDDDDKEHNKAKSSPVPRSNTIVKNDRRESRQAVPKQSSNQTCNFCIQNNFQVIHHHESKCWRKLNTQSLEILLTSSDSEDCRSDEEDSEEEPDDSQDNEEDLHLQDSEEESDDSQDNEEDLHLQNLFDELSESTDDDDNSLNDSNTETDSETKSSSSDPSVFSRDTVVRHPGSCEDLTHGDQLESQHDQEQAQRPRLQGQCLPGRAIQRNLAPPRPPRNIPGRLASQGDLIKYFSGYADENDEEIWIAAVIDHMPLTQQRLHPTYYNITDETGNKLSLEILPGGPVAIKRNDEWVNL